jgi:opacity protein-like surface antigen
MGRSRRVGGIEADIQSSRQPGRTTTFDCAGATCNAGLGALGFDAPVSARMEQRLEWFGTLRARLGATPTPASLIYATGGLAVGRIKTSGSVSGSSLGLTDGVTQGVAIDVDADGNPIEVPVDVPIVIASADPTSTTFFSQKTKAGWTVGAGAEVRLGGNWTGKVEYLYLDFGNVSFSRSTWARNTSASTDLLGSSCFAAVRAALIAQCTANPPPVAAPAGSPAPPPLYGPYPSAAPGGSLHGVPAGYGAYPGALSAPPHLPHHPHASRGRLSPAPWRHNGVPFVPGASVSTDETCRVWGNAIALPPGGRRRLPQIMSVCATECTDQN